MRFPRQEYWSGLPFPSPGNLPKPGIEPWSLARQADSLPSEPPGKPVIVSQTFLAFGDLDGFEKCCSCVGEGNSNPLQCSCLENHRDGGAWWAAVYGVAQSRTRLK